MRQYRATLAYDVCCYATVVFDAEGDAEALLKCKRILLEGEEDARFDPEWDLTNSERVVELEVVEEGDWRTVEEGLYADEIRDPPPPSPGGGI